MAIIHKIGNGPKKEEGKPIPTKTLWVVCGIVVAGGMVVIKTVANLVEVVVVAVLEVHQ